VWHAADIHRGTGTGDQLRLLSLEATSSGPAPAGCRHRDERGRSDTPTGYLAIHPRRLSVTVPEGIVMITRIRIENGKSKNGDWEHTKVVSVFRSSGSVCYRRQRASGVLYPAEPTRQPPLANPTLTDAVSSVVDSVAGRPIVLFFTLRLSTLRLR
jgi:hypothetical protein